MVRDPTCDFFSAMVWVLRIELLFEMLLEILVT